MKLDRAFMAIALSGALALPVMAQSNGSGSASTSGSAAGMSSEQTHQPAGSQSSASSMPQSDQQADTSSSSGKKSKSKKSNPDATNTNASTTNMRVPTRKDRIFMEKAAIGGLMEVDLGNAVKDKAQDPQVKDFANRMVTDHTKANDELKNLMSQKGLSAPTDLPAKDKATVDKIKSKSGADLDKSYMADMVKDHDKDVKEFQNEAKNGDDPDVKAWAAKTVTTLEDHDKQANEIAKKVGAEGNMKYKHETKKEAKAQSKNP
jgi:putative membrane protein